MDMKTHATHAVAASGIVSLNHPPSRVPLEGVTAEGDVEQGVARNIEGCRK